ncbi:carboxylating nicotinate-nucleotide diphosphorylase [Chloroflexota bacterium]
MNKPRITEEQLNNIIELALSEDIGTGDITSQILIPSQLQGKASILVKAKGILAGNEIAKMLFLKVDPSLKVELLVKDGTNVKPGDKISTVSGKISSIFKAERVALNILQRLSGIASETARYVAEIRGLNAKIIDTRKTTPGIRLLEKYAVVTGGGQNHRFNLCDGIIIKDTHIAALRSLGMNLKDIITKAKENAPKGLAVEVEVSNFEEASEAAKAEADIIMLDNMSSDEMRHAVSLIPNHIKTEASGGITLNNVRGVASTGVNTISIGALTHSPKALDISLEIEPRTIKLV